jgi:hypothetical protein
MTDFTMSVQTVYLQAQHDHKTDPAQMRMVTRLRISSVCYWCLCNRADPLANNQSGVQETFLSETGALTAGPTIQSHLDSSLSASRCAADVPYHFPVTLSTHSKHVQRTLPVGIPARLAKSIGKI